MAVLSPGVMANPWTRLVLILLITVVKGQTVLRIGGAFGITGGSGLQTKPGCDIAIEDINMDDTLLPDHELVMDSYDTEGTPSVGLGSFTAFYFASNLTWFGHLGPGRSVVSTPVAQLADYHTMPIISYSSTSPELSDKSSYPFFMRVVGPDDNQGLAWATIAREYGWNRVGLLSSTESIHEDLARAFQTEAVSSGISVETFLTFDPGASDEV